MLLVQNRTSRGMVIEPEAGTYALILSCASNAVFRLGAWERCNSSTGITFTWAARWGLGVCGPGLPTIKSCQRDRTGTSTTCEHTPRLSAFGLVTMCGDVSTNGPASWVR
jgi:hypothetical protein